MAVRESARMPGKGLPDIYFPLIFLMSEGRVLHRQKEFFVEMFVQVRRAEE